jgi:hypothetical protein
MARETINRHRVGKRTARASIGWTTPVGPDATHWDVEYGDGERGVDDTDGRRCPTAALARSWAAKRVQQIPREHPGARIHYLQVVVERWDPDEFEDDVYGLVLDVECISETEQYGYVGDDGTITWDDPEPVSSW